MSDNEGPDTGVSAPEEGVFSEPVPVDLTTSIMDEISGMATVTPGAEPPTDYKAPEPKQLEEEMHFPKVIEAEPSDTISVEPAAADPATATPTRVYSQDEYDALMSLVAQQLTAPTNQGQPQAQNQGVPVAQHVPVTAPVAPAAPVQQGASRAYITPENHEAFLTDPDVANQILMQAANDMYQQAMLNTVPIAMNASRHEVQMQNMVADFHRANPDLTGLDPSIVATLANQYSAENPNFKPIDVFKGLGDYTRGRLKMSKAQAAAAPTVPKFAPRPSASGVAAPANRSARLSVQDELRELSNLTSQFMH